MDLIRARYRDPDAAPSPPPPPRHRRRLSPAPQFYIFIVDSLPCFPRRDLVGLVSYLLRCRCRASQSVQRRGKLLGITRPALCTRLYLRPSLSVRCDSDLNMESSTAGKRRTLKYDPLPLLLMLTWCSRKDGRKLLVCACVKA